MMAVTCEKGHRIRFPQCRFCRRNKEGQDVPRNRRRYSGVCSDFRGRG